MKPFDNLRLAMRRTDEAFDADLATLEVEVGQAVEDHMSPVERAKGEEMARIGRLLDTESSLTAEIARLNERLAQTRRMRAAYEMALHVLADENATPKEIERDAA